MDRSVGTGELRQAKKSEQREVARVREMISNKQQHIPVTELIGHINRHFTGDGRPITIPPGGAILSHFDQLLCLR